LHLLRDLGIVSVPVVDNWRIYARISTFDILSYLCSGVCIATNLNRPISKVIKYFENSVPAYRKDLIDYATVVIPFQLAQLFTIGTLFNPFSIGLHRLLVEVRRTPFSSDLMNLSQTDVLRYISAHPYLIPDEIKHKPLTVLNIISKNIVAVDSNTPVLEAFKNLNRLYLSAVVVVEPSTKAAISSLSTSDLRKLDIDTLNKMKQGMKVIDFLTTGRNLKKLFYVSPDETIIEVIDRMLLGATHRVWLVDDNKVPYGVISMTDVMAIFAGRARQPNLETGIFVPGQ